ncbi:MAG: all-trans-retinol 13,14-reductase [Flavobacteriales bacterium CG_4_10_14_0_2_um_filter_32_8]|nr:MAG: all-trans-retinol 13,14-reductase [Flavobacteriales bacterium CG_4_10_14_0_2_um_filter_32_8]
MIGSGLGGLACAYILASEGHSVIVLEKNHQIGGNLQVFSREKCIFDTGVHYIGSLDEGENLNQFFKYFGLMKKLKLKRMDEDGFDVIRFKDGKEFKHAQGYENFIATLTKQFPEEKNAIVSYCNAIKETCQQFPVYNLEIPNSSHVNNIALLSMNAYEHIAAITSNKLLQNVLAGTNGLYAGEKESTPWYVHALIMNSYLTGAYRLKDGGSQIAIHMSKSIKALGAEIYKRKEVVGANFKENGEIQEVILKSGEVVKGKKFISNVHPAITIDIFGENRFLKAYTKRIKGLKDTSSSFIVHLVFKENTFNYLNYNIYQVNIDDVWGTVNYNPKEWPQSYFVCTPANSKNETFAESMSVMTYMDSKETDQWADTHNTIANKNNRGADYEAFKKEKEEKVITVLEEQFPDIRLKIKSIYSTTPLTFRDYIGDKTGALYGIAKDNRNPLKTSINSRTKIKNLSLTGQNIVLHGVLGVTIGAFVTCFEFVDKHQLINKVKNS